jgi:hypothetical protein
MAIAGSSILWELPGANGEADIYREMSPDAKSSTARVVQTEQARRFEARVEDTGSKSKN